MYFIDEKGLRGDLLQNRVSPTDFAIYFFLAFGIQLRIWYPVSVPSSEELPGDWTLVLIWLASKIITITGFVACFRANGGAAGDAFLNRFVALAWVSLFQLTLVAFPVYLLIEKYAPELVAEPGGIAAPVLHLAFYSRLWLMISRLRADAEQAV